MRTTNSDMDAQADLNLRWAYISEAVISQRRTFPKLCFHRGVHFPKLCFHRGVHFRNCVFHRDVHLRSCVFTEAYISESVLSQRPTFPKLCFHRGVHFRSCVITEVYISESVFSQRCTFPNLCFHRGVHFRSCVFIEAYISEAVFSRRRTFPKLCFTEAYISDVVFSQNANHMNMYTFHVWHKLVHVHFAFQNNICCEIQSTLVISKSNGLSEILRDSCTSAYRICRIEEK